MSPEQQDKTEDATAQMRRIMDGFWVSQAVFTAARLGIADHLTDEAQDIEHLAALAGAHPASLYRLLRALSSIGICAEISPRRFALTPLATCLRSDTPGSVRSWAISMGELAWKPWGELQRCMQDGQSAFPLVYGQSRYAYLAQHPALAAQFDHAMAAFATQIAESIATHYAGVALGKIIDVGGGQGALLAALLHARPGSSGILLERADVSARARTLLDKQGLAERCQCIAGDFLKSVPESADTCILSAILHNWADHDAALILQNCRNALHASGRLLIIDSVLKPDSGLHANFLDLHMLVMHGGQERTRDEFLQLITSAGLRLVRIIPMAGSNIIECQR
ncbi:MAG: methyltransferase [Nitrosomonadales bacterium]|nr:methyltransferase [Nitrosomonadales bacterium]